MGTNTPLFDKVADEVITDAEYRPLPDEKIALAKTQALALAKLIASYRAQNYFYRAEKLMPRLFAIGYKADPEVTAYVKALTDTLETQAKRRAIFEPISNDEINASLKMLEQII